MASVGVVVPVIAAALGALGPLVGKIGSTLINIAEAFLPAGKKMPVVLTTLQSILQTMGAAGQLPQTVTTLPTEAQLEQALEGVLAKMKADGTLVASLSGAVPGAAAAPNATVQSMTIARSVLTSLIGDGGK